MLWHWPNQSAFCSASFLIESDFLIASFKSLNSAYLTARNLPYRKIKIAEYPIPPSNVSETSSFNPCSIPALAATRLWKRCLLALRNPVMCPSLRLRSTDGFAARSLSMDIPWVFHSQSSNSIARDRWLSPLRNLIFADGFESPAIWRSTTRGSSFLHTGSDVTPSLHTFDKHFSILPKLSFVFSTNFSVELGGAGGSGCAWWGEVCWPREGPNRFSLLKVNGNEELIFGEFGAEWWEIEEGEGRPGSSVVGDDASRRVTTMWAVLCSSTNDWSFCTAAWSSVLWDRSKSTEALQSTSRASSTQLGSPGDIRKRKRLKEQQTALRIVRPNIGANFARPLRQRSLSPKLSLIGWALTTCCKNQPTREGVCSILVSPTAHIGVLARILVINLSGLPFLLLGQPRCTGGEDTAVSHVLLGRTVHLGRPHRPPWTFLIIFNI